MIGLLGLATYVFTAVFVYMSEKDLEHNVLGTTKKQGSQAIACARTPASPPTLPNIARTSDEGKDSISFEQFRDDGFVEIDLERQVGIETMTMKERLEPKDRKKTRLTLFN